jgi:LemA protein
MELILWLPAGLLLVGAVTIYNLLIRDKNRVLAAWSDIDVQLKRRHDLLPKLVDAVRAYASYEKSTLEEITRLRTDAEQIETPVEKSRLETMITGRVRELIAVAEAYPDLKANRQFVDLMQQLSDVENHIQLARRYYNGAVRNLNIRIDSFPDLLIARLFGFKPAEFFQLDSATEGSPPELSL